MITAKIIGSDGQQIKVNGEGEISVVIHQHPPIDEEVTALPFRQYFTDNGLSTGSNIMAVDGSVNFKDFYIGALQEVDIYVKYITCEIGDGGTPALNKFGSLTALTNGVSWLWINQKDPDYVLHEGIKTNKEFIRIASDTAGIGTGVDAFLADVSGGASEKSYLPNIDLKEIYGLPWGVRLRKGTNDRIIFRVQDDLTELTTFNAIATGTRL